MSAPSDADAPHASKLDEQARAKGDLSYSYWAATDRPANSGISPKKLSESATSQMQQDDRSNSQHTASAWNSAGTFEERDVTEWAKQQLQVMLVTASSSDAAVTKVNSITGHANIWFIRGKKRHGFDFSIELSWQLSSNKDIKGTFKVADATPDDLDDLHTEVKLEKASGDATADSSALQAAAGLKRQLQAQLQQFYSQLKAM